VRGRWLSATTPLFHPGLHLPGPEQSSASGKCCNSTILALGRPGHVVLTEYLAAAAPGTRGLATSLARPATTSYRLSPTKPPTSVARRWVAILSSLKRWSVQQTRGGSTLGPSPLRRSRRFTPRAPDRDFPAAATSTVKRRIQAAVCTLPGGVPGRSRSRRSRCTSSSPTSANSGSGSASSSASARTSARWRSGPRSRG
jgi:hypothetical protein